MHRVWSRIDLALRFAYVLVAPLFLVVAANLIPMTGVLVGVGIATTVALIGAERWRARTARIRFVGGFLGKLAALGDYYREHPPKPLLYYIFYPVLFPYWLFVRDARREFLLYRRLNLVALLAIPAFAAYEYVTKWAPEIPFAVFLAQTIASLIVQLLVTFAFVMPIVTTIVAFHSAGHRKVLAVLFVLAGAVGVASIVFTIRRDRPSTFTVKRMAYRAAADTQRAGKLLAAAVTAAEGAYRTAPADHTAARTAMLAELQQLWRSDEARLFQLYRGADGTTALYVNIRKKPTIWLARLPTGRFTIDPEAVPAELRGKLERPRVPTR